MKLRAPILAVLISLLPVTAIAATDPPEPPGDDPWSKIRDGIDTGYTHKQTSALVDVWPGGASETSPTAWYEYVAVIDCRPPNTPQQPKLEICTEAVTFCEERVPDSVGPRSWIYRRIVHDDGTTGEWLDLAPTCFTSSVPPRSGEPAEELTDAMILEQFHQTAFALPEMVIQPPDGRTLVNLPVYFELSWPEAGFEPGEVDTTTIVGHQVRIRPTLVGVTYVTGDGASIGPTTSLGGPYPTGDITHDYSRVADVTPFISVEYGGEVSVDGGTWRVIPGSATVEGPASPLQVLSSQNRLYTN